MSDILNHSAMAITYKRIIQAIGTRDSESNRRSKADNMMPQGRQRHIIFVLTNHIKVTW